MRSDRESAAAWEAALDHVIQGAHLAIGEDLSTLLDDAVRPLGLTAEMLVADTAQRVLTALRPGPPHRIDLAASIGGQAYQLGEILPDADADGGPLLWVPVLDGTDRLGVVRVGFTGHGDRAAHDDTRLRRRLLTMASLMGHVLGSKTVYSDQLRRRRSNGPLTPASELLWQLLPPRTVATERVVVSATLEPQRDVAGDAFDYNVEGDVVDLAVYDAAGHDLRASITTALAITGVRNARRSGEEDLAAIAAHADTLIDAQPGPRQFATAFLARLDTVRGTLAYLNAGHVPPLLIRRGNVVQRLEGPHRAPLGITRPQGWKETAQQQLEPGDRLLIYSDGITEARDQHGVFFGEDQLVELTEHAAAAGISTPETLRRLATAVLDHQQGRLQDDATLVLVEWSAAGHERMLPTLRASTQRSGPTAEHAERELGQDQHQQ